MRIEAELLIDCCNDLGETPVWCARTQTLLLDRRERAGSAFFTGTRRAAVG